MRFEPRLTVLSGTAASIMLLVSACATETPAPHTPEPPRPAPRPLAPLPTTAAPTEAPPVPALADRGPLAPELVDALGVAGAPLPPVAAPVIPPRAPAAPPPPHGFTLEAPSLPGPVFTEEQAATSPVLLGQQTEAIARWNLGGTSRDDHPSRKTGFHPGTRVVVDLTVAGAFGASAKRSAVRQQAEARARARGYWPLRSCYEASWRAGLDKPTDHTIRATVLGSGRVQATRLLKTEGPDELGPCLRRALGELELGSLPARRIDADLRIRFWPGDAPPPRDAEPATDACAADDATGPLDRAEQAWRANTAALNACIEPALARDRALWGRLAFRTLFDRTGRTSAVTEFQTTFPDSAVVRCVSRVIESFEIGEHPCRADLVFALRVGNPELP